MIRLPTQTAISATSEVRPTEVEADGLTLSGLHAHPVATAPRAVLVALHGGGMRAGYFHGQADPATSLLSLAADCGYAALALDRPGYGNSAATLSEGMELTGQAACTRAALTTYARLHPVGAGFFVVGHSLGGQLALSIAAQWSGDNLLGVDVSGLTDTWAIDPTQLNDRRTHLLHWGPPALYPPGTFRMAQSLVNPLPSREAQEVPDWPKRYPQVAGRVRVPVRFTFAEHERWWKCDPATVDVMTARLASPSVSAEWLQGAGHNISLGKAARTYHLRTLAFLEDCLVKSREVV